ncbi:hypothetical protein SUDANB6_05181 [Streptomyces sp. enrichment culture]
MIVHVSCAGFTVPSLTAYGDIAGTVVLDALRRLFDDGGA